MIHWNRDISCYFKHWLPLDGKIYIDLNTNNECISQCFIWFSHLNFLHVFTLILPANLFFPLLSCFWFFFNRENKVLILIPVSDPIKYEFPVIKFLQLFLKSYSSLLICRPWSFSELAVGWMSLHKKPYESHIFSCFHLLDFLIQNFH